VLANNSSVPIRRRSLLNRISLKKIIESKIGRVVMNKTKAVELQQGFAKHQKYQKSCDQGFFGSLTSLIVILLVVAKARNPKSNLSRHNNTSPPSLVRWRVVALLCSLCSAL
jgi:hypothetical protein